MNVKRIRKDFPILKTKIRGHALIYFDNAATTQKPAIVIETMSNFYRRDNASVHRGIHMLSQEATVAFENVRLQIRKFLNARHAEEIIFTAGATGGINLIARSFGNALLKKGDCILLTEGEHHSNIVPWQMLAKQKGLKIGYAPLLPDGRLDPGAYKKMLNRKIKLVAMTVASNVTGVINPLKKIIISAHRAGAKVLVDAAQFMAHATIDVQKIDCDFLVFSGHKMLGPTGIGILYGKKELLEKMPPFLAGGGMIAKVTKQNTIYADPPEKFEAGTPAISEVIGLGAAIEYLNKLGLKNIQEKEKVLTKYMLKKISGMRKLRLLGPSDSKQRLPIFSFVLEGIPDHDIASLLDEKGIAVRSGHHCAQILHEKFGVASSVRASLCFYNTTREIDKFISALNKIVKIFNS